jgi:hypothetical protein
MLDGNQFTQRLLAAGIAAPGEIVPCSSENIDRVRGAAGGRLPRAYVDFLRTAGRGAGHFLTDVAIFYDKMIGLSELALDILRDWDSPLTLPPGAFVFAERRREQFLFFVDDGKTDDPPVYHYLEGGAQFTQLAGSIWSYLEAELRAEEELRREFPDLPRWRRPS